MAERDQFSQALGARLRLSPLNAAFDQATMGPLLESMTDRAFERDVVSVVRNNPGLAANRLEGIRKVLEARGIRPSKPLLLATLIKSNISHPFLERAISSMERGDNGGFLVNFDIYMGASIVCDSIMYAESAIRGNLDETVAGNVGDLKDIYEDHGVEAKDAEQAEAFVNARLLGRKLGELLKADPTGFSLMNYIVEEMSHIPRPRLIPEYMVVEIVEAGAQFAAKTYKAVYPLLDNSLKRGIGPTDQN